MEDEALSTPTDIKIRRWKRVEYERLVECEIFKPGERIELIDGLLVLKEPQGSSHATGIRLAQEALRRAFGTGWDVRPQLPVALDDESEPEPDVSVVPGSPRTYIGEHPSRPVLVVEVSWTNLRLDRAEKASLYARAGVPEYWIVNLVDAVLEVRRSPVPAASERYGWQYGDIMTLGRDASVSPLAAPAATIPVGDLLP